MTILLHLVLAAREVERRILTTKRIEIKLLMLPVKTKQQQRPKKQQQNTRLKYLRFLNFNQHVELREIWFTQR